MTGLDAKLARLADAGPAELLSGQRVGIEKESLRVADNAVLAKTPHPKALGAALTHPHITMDFSEAMLELITPPLPGNRAVLEFLGDLHAWIYRQLGEETLWPSSMPCITKSETDIPLAHFGESNAGQMKTIYRRGLGRRYGRAMQMITGVHYNYSFGENLWPALADVMRVDAAQSGTRSELYLGLTRNLLRFGWIVPFLFGSSPAICRSFVDPGASLEKFDDHTLYLPYATSLRMGDIGYQNNQEIETGGRVSYNSLREYVVSLKLAVEQPCPLYAPIGVKVNGRYEQINDHILQIENEFYASVRPKRTAREAEMPLLALARRGVEYVELRSLDLLAFSPLGVCETQLDFLEGWLLFCLLDDSPPLSADDLRDAGRNEVRTAHEGRAPDMRLDAGGDKIPLRDAGLDLCARMAGVCELLDAARGDARHSEALAAHREMFANPERTPSARMLGEMREHRVSYIEWAEQKGMEFRDHHLARALPAETERRFNRLAEDSLRRLAEIERSDRVSLDEYIQNYFRKLGEIDGSPGRNGDAVA